MIAEYAAVSDRLKADSALTVRDTVYDAQGLVVRASYVVLFGGAPDELSDDRVTKVPDLSSDATYVYTARCVSTTAGGARTVLEHVMTQFVGFAPAVAGRRCDPIRLTHATDVEPDASILPPLFFTDAEFTLVSRRG